MIMKSISYSRIRWNVIMITALAVFASNVTAQDFYKAAVKEYLKNKSNVALDINSARSIFKEVNSRVLLGFGENRTEAVLQRYCDSRFHDDFIGIIMVSLYRDSLSLEDINTLTTLMKSKEGIEWETHSNMVTKLIQEKPQELTELVNINIKLFSQNLPLQNAVKKAEIPDDYSTQFLQSVNPVEIASIASVIKGLIQLSSNNYRVDKMTTVIQHLMDNIPTIMMNYSYGILTKEDLMFQKRLNSIPAYVVEMRAYQNLTKVVAQNMQKLQLTYVNWLLEQKDVCDFLLQKAVDAANIAIAKTEIDGNKSLMTLEPDRVTLKMPFSETGFSTAIITDKMKKSFVSEFFNSLDNNDIPLMMVNSKRSMVFIFYDDDNGKTVADITLSVQEIKQLYQELNAPREEKEYATTFGKFIECCPSVLTLVDSKKFLNTLITENGKLLEGFYEFANSNVSQKEGHIVFSKELVVVDGIPVARELAPDDKDFSSLSILNPGEALAIYGKKGVNGVTAFTTKQNHLRRQFAKDRKIMFSYLVAMKYMSEQFDHDLTHIMLLQEFKEIVSAKDLEIVADLMQSIDGKQFQKHFALMLDTLVDSRGTIYSREMVRAGNSTIAKTVMKEPKISQQYAEVFYQALDTTLVKLFLQQHLDMEDVDYQIPTKVLNLCHGILTEQDLRFWIQLRKSVEGRKVSRALINFIGNMVSKNPEANFKLSVIDWKESYKNWLDSQEGYSEFSLKQFTEAINSMGNKNITSRLEDKNFIMMIRYDDKTTLPAYKMMLENYGKESLSDYCKQYFPTIFGKSLLTHLSTTQRNIVIRLSDSSNQIEVKLEQQELKKTIDDIGSWTKLQMGIDFVDNKKYNDAMPLLLQAAKDGLPAAQYQLAGLYMDDGTENINVVEALKWYTKAAEQNNAKQVKNDALTTLAYIYANLEQYQKALQLAEQAVSEFPNVVSNHVCKGVVLCMKGDKKAAREVWQKVVSLEPDFANDHESDFYQLLFGKK